MGYNHVMNPRWLIAALSFVAGLLVASAVIALPLFMQLRAAQADAKQARADRKTPEAEVQPSASSPSPSSPARFQNIAQRTCSS